MGGLTGGRGLLAVPGEVRRALGIKGGDPLGVEVKGDVIVLRPRVQSTAVRLRGTGKGIYGPDPVAYVRALRDEWEDRPDPRRV